MILYSAAGALFPSATRDACGSVAGFASDLVAAGVAAGPVPDATTVGAAGFSAAIICLAGLFLSCKRIS